MGVRGAGLLYIVVTAAAGVENLAMAGLFG